MPGLSEEELRMLEQMERALIEEDPKLASTLRGGTVSRAARTRAVLAGIVFLAGVGLLLGGAISQIPALGVLGFVVMLVAAAAAVSALRRPTSTGQADQARPAAPRDSRHAGFGVVDGGKRPGPRRQRSSGGSMMDRFEERWRQRRERGF